MHYKRGNFIANASQSTAITHPLGPLMIIAGAGTGKTTTLLHRIYYLIEYYKLKPENILTITYTEKAAEELKTRIIQSIGDDAKAMTISTFHAFCYNTVKTYQTNSNSSPILMETGDAIYLFMQNFDSLGPFESQQFVTDPVKSITKSFIPFIDRLRDELIDPINKSNPLSTDENVTAETIAQLNDLKRIYPLYQQWKEDHHFVDFGDMIFRCHKLFQSDAEILDQVKDQYRYMIIDEFQDNNYALNEVVSQIIGTNGQITVVGDEDQVIYSFRGASKYNIDTFRQSFSDHNNYAEIALEENFRSTQQILNVANNSISNAKHREHKTLSAFGGKSGKKPQLLRSDNDNHAQIIADKVNELALKFDFQDMAVLCRTKAQVKTVAEKLADNNIPTRTYLINYFEIPEIKDLLAWCNLIAETKDQDAGLYRIIARSVNQKFASDLFNRFAKRDYTPRYDLILKSPLRMLSKLINDIGELRDLNLKKNASEMIWEICISTRIFRPLISRYEWQDQLAILNIGHFINRGIEFAVRHLNDNDLWSFTNYMTVLQESNSIQPIYPADKHIPQTVLVNTIHGVKGAEFPVIFIPYNSSAKFPLSFNRSKFVAFPPETWKSYQTNLLQTTREQHYEEERRLFYVGLTRPKELLYLCAPNKRTSIFIKELNQDLLKVTDMENNINEPVKNHSQLRDQYEKRLAKTLNQNQFERSKDILNAIERIDLIEQNANISWTNTEWENELKSQLSKTTPIKLPEKLSLSASSIETYDQCPLKYRLSNIDKIPQAGSKPQLTFGTIIHRVLEQFHQPDYEISLNRLLNLLENNWESLGFDYETQEADFKRQGTEILTSYYNYLLEHPVCVEEREHQFSFEIEDVIINGKIDRIDKVGKGYSVIDYKTSQTVSKAKKSVQLAIYALYLQQEQTERFGGLPESTILYFLRAEEPIHQHSFSQEELTAMRDRIRTTAENIRHQRFEPCKGWHCDWCDFKQLLCPEWEED